MPLSRKPFADTRLLEVANADVHFYGHEAPLRSLYRASIRQSIPHVRPDGILTLPTHPEHLLHWFMPDVLLVTTRWNQIISGHFRWRCRQTLWRKNDAGQWEAVMALSRDMQRRKQELKLLAELL